MPFNPNNQVILCPAAGYGVRVGRPAAKELLTHPFKNKKLIEIPLEYGIENQNKVHIISREKKDMLNQFLEDYKKQSPLLSYQTINVQGEWPETLLKSKDYWEEKNLLWLPDTDFDLTVVKRIFFLLEEYDIVFATFSVTDETKWGMVSFKKDYFWIADKPAQKRDLALAWGLIGFRKGLGESLFSAISESNQDRDWKKFSEVSFANVELTNFVDLTRGDEGLGDT